MRKHELPLLHLDRREPSPLQLITQPQGELNRPRLITLSTDPSETPRAEVRVGVAKVHSVEDIAELGFEPHFQSFPDWEHLEQAEVFVISGE